MCDDQGPEPEPSTGFGRKLLGNSIDMLATVASAIPIPGVGIAASIGQSLYHSFVGDGGGGGGGGPDIAGCMNRNYEAIQANGQAIAQNYAAIQENYQAILLVESKVDEVYAELKGAKTEILDSIRESTYKPIISSLKTFLNDYQIKSQELQSLSKSELIVRLENPEGFMNFLKELIKPKPDNLHGRLNDIINQNLAIPKDAEDFLAFTMLFLLINGAISYVSILNTLNEQYTVLVEHYYETSDLEAYNKFVKLRYDVYKDIANGLISDQTGLLDKVIATFDAVSAKFPEEDELIEHFAKSKEDVRQLKETVVDQVNSLVTEIPKKITINLDFKKSKVKTPVASWSKGKKVSYAIQYRDEEAKKNTIVSKWSAPYKISKSACPIVKIPKDSKGRTRIIFRKFDSEPAQLVATIAASNVTAFTDIDRDAFNAAAEANEEEALEDIQPFVDNGANINAAFDKRRTPLHMAAANGNINLARYLIEHGAVTNATDVNGYTALHNAAYKGEVDFVETVLGEELIDANVRASNLNTPLHSAVIANNGQMVEVLLANNKTNISAQNANGQSALHIAAINGFEDTVEAILNSNQANVTINSPAKLGFTALHFALSKNHEGVALKLIENQFIDVNVQDFAFNSAPLHMAASADQHEVALALLNKGALVDIPGQDNQTPLHVAIINKSDQTTEILLSNGADVTAQSSDAMTPMHYAARYFDEDVMTSLLKHGSPVNFPERNDLTPIYYALKYDNPEAVKMLMTNCAKNSFGLINGKTLLHLAIQNGDLNVVEGLIKLGLDVNDKKNKDSVSPIDIALEEGNFEIIEVLLKNKAKVDFLFDWNEDFDDIDAKLGKLKLDEAESMKMVKLLKKEKLEYLPASTLYACREGYLELLESLMDNNFGYHVMTCLEHAIRYGQLNIVEFLDKKYQLNLIVRMQDVIKYSGNLELFKYIGEKPFQWTNLVNEKSQSFAHLAAKENNLGILKYVLEKIKAGYEYQYQNFQNKEFYINGLFIQHVDQLDSSGRTPLMLAIEKDGDAKVVEYLLSLGAKVDLVNENGQTALYSAAKEGKFEVVKLLIEKGADVSVSDSKDVPVLVAAIKNDGQLDIVKYLVEHKAETDFKDEETGETLVNLALSAGKPEVVKYLLEKGVKYELYSDFETWTFLHEAAYHGNLELVEKILKDHKEIDLKKKDKNERDAAQVAVHGDNANFEVVKLLILNGADLNSVDDSGYTIVHRAIRYGKTDIVDFLLESGADFKKATKEGTTPMQTAVSKNYFDIVQMLLDKGADVNEKNGDPILLSVTSFEMLKLLLEYGADPLVKSKDKGQTLFDIAVKKVEENPGYQDIIKYFIFDFKTASGKTLLHELTNLDTIEYIVEHGGNLNALDNEKLTPLHVAAQKNTTDFLNYLLAPNNCVNLNVKSKANETAFDMAKRLGLKDNEKLLEEQMKNRVKRALEDSLQPICSSAGRPGSVINSMVSAMIRSVGGFMVGMSQFISFATALPAHKASLNSPAILYANPHINPTLSPTPTPTPSPIEVNSTLLLIDVFTRKLTGKPYISPIANPLTQHDARGYALSVTEHFEKALNAAALQLGIERRPFDSFELYKAVDSYAVSGEFEELQNMLYTKMLNIYPEIIEFE